MTVHGTPPKVDAARNLPGRELAGEGLRVRKQAARQVMQ